MKDERKVNVILDEKDKEQEIKKYVEEKSPNYLETYATGIEGGPFGPYDFRLNFYEESVDKENGELIFRKNFKAKIVVSYATAKQLVLWMNKHLENYEERSGHRIYVGEKE
jgi:hypothetical protein